MQAIEVTATRKFASIVLARLHRFVDRDRQRLRACPGCCRRPSAWRRTRRARARTRAASRPGCRAMPAAARRERRPRLAPTPSVRAACSSCESTVSKAARADLHTSGKPTTAAAITAPCQVKIRRMPKRASASRRAGRAGRPAPAGSSRARSAASPSAACRTASTSSRPGKRSRAIAKPMPTPSTRFNAVAHSATLSVRASATHAASTVRRGPRQGLPKPCLASTACAGADCR